MPSVDELLGLQGDPQPKPTKPAGNSFYDDVRSVIEPHAGRITSTNGGRHNTGSAHYRGEAVDVGMARETPQQQEAIKAQLEASGYLVRDERTRPVGQAVWSGPHLHITKRGGGGSGGGGSTGGFGGVSVDSLLGGEAPSAAPDFSNLRTTSGSTEPAAGAPDYSGAFVDPGNPLETKNPLFGLVDRANKLVGSGIRGVANIAEPLGDKLEAAIPLSGLTPEQISGERQLQPLYDIADWFSDDVIKYAPTTNLDEVKSIVDTDSADSFLDRAGTLGSFVGERVVTSIPDMVAAAGALPAYILGRTNEIATRRVDNDGRTGEPGLGDMAAALPAATGEALLERFATKALPGLGSVPGKSAVGRIAAQTGIQTGTEAAEEGIANLGESLGTERGVDPQELMDAMMEGGIVGGGMGGGVQTVAEGVSAVRGATTAPAATPAPAPRSADSFLDAEPAAAVQPPVGETVPPVGNSEVAQPVTDAPPVGENIPLVGEPQGAVPAELAQLEATPAQPAQEEVMRDGSDGVPEGDSRPVAPPVAAPMATGEQAEVAAPVQEAAPAVVKESLTAEPERQRVFHGSRRTGIEQIQLDRSGSGSGDSNYGFGAYFAGNREGADSIRASTSAIARMPGGKVADAALAAAKGDRAEAARALRARRGRVDEKQRIEIDRALETLRAAPNRGTTYQTEIPADNRLMSWDEPIQAQPVRVQQALTAIGFSDPQMTAGAAYRALSTREGGQRQASDALAAEGVPGHRYKDGRGGYHYVVWNEGDIGKLADADQVAAPAPSRETAAEPLLEMRDDRPAVPDRTEPRAQSSGDAAPREAAGMEDRSESPDQSKRGRGASDEFAKASVTNRRSWSQKAFRDAGLDPDAAELLPAEKQFAAVAGLIAKKFGVTAKATPKVPTRMAIDSATDLYRNAQTMASVLGLPEKAIGLGDSLTLLFRGETPYLGAMYPKGSTVEGVEIPAGAIVLPRRSNSFAHEWGHALDLHLFSKYGLGDGKLVSREVKNQGIDYQPNSSKEAFAKLMNSLFLDDADLAARVGTLQQAATGGTPAQQTAAKEALARIAAGNSRLKIKGTEYLIESRSYGADIGGKSGAKYFGDPAEMMARAFESYIAEKIEAVGGDVAVLAKGDAAYLSNTDDRFAKTYPKLDERLRIFAAFDDLFGQLAKEQIIASGVPAANPGNLDAFDPRIWLEDVPKPDTYRGVKGAIREQADQWNAAREQAKRESARPADPMSRKQRIQNALMTAATPIQGTFRVMERRYPKSAALRELADKLVTAPGIDRNVGRVLEQATRITGGRSYNQFGNIVDRYGLNKLDEAGERKLTRLLVSAEDPANVAPEMVKAAAELRRFMDTLWYDNQEAGINIGYTPNGFLPRMLDMAMVQSDPAGFIEAAAKAYKINLEKDPDIDPAQIDELAEAEARAWHFNTTNAQPISFGSRTPAENYTKHRSLPAEADVLLEKFYVQSPLERIHRYIGMSAKNVEFAKAFGEKGERLNDLFARMARDGVPLEDQQYLQGTVNNLLGRQGAGVLEGKPRAQALMNQVNAYGVMSMLGRVLISSIMEPGVAGIRTRSAANVFRPYFNLMKQTIGTADMKAWREITRAIGMIGDAQADMIVQARLGGTFESTPKTDARLARYFTITGLHALTNAQRVSLMPIAHQYINRIAAQVAEGGKAGKEARALLAELGIEDAAAMVEWMGDSRPTMSTLFDKSGLETEQGAIYMTAMSRLNEQIVQAPYRFDRPELANSPTGRFLYGIMSFNLAFWNNVYKREANVIARRAKESGPLAAAGDVAYMAAPILAYFFTQLLVTSAREALLNPQRWEEWDRDDELEKNLILLTLSRSFPAGLFDIPIQAYQGLKYQRDITSVAVGAVPSYFLMSIQKMVQVFQDSNSEKTNNAEFAGMQGAYQMFANPAIAHVLTSLPGGRIMDPVYGLALAYGTAAAARDNVAEAVVGERDSLVAKRERDARKASGVQSRGSSPRGDGRKSEREEVKR